MFITKIEVQGDSGRKYEVAVGPEGAKCSCPAYKYRAPGRAICKHIEYVADKVFGSRRAQAAAGTSLVSV